MVSAVGFSLLGASIGCNGSGMMPYRVIFPEVPLDPVIFQLYASLGILIAHWLSVALLSLNDQFIRDGSTVFVFSKMGLISGIIVSFAQYFGYVAVSKVGIGVGQGIAAGTAVLTSYVWATALFHERPDQLYISIIGLVMNVIGNILVALCKALSFYRSKNNRKGPRKPLLDEETKDLEESVHDEKSLSTEGEGILFGGNRAVARENDEDLLRLLRAQERNDYQEIYTHGVIAASLSGILSGSYLAPLMYAPHDERGLVFLPSFGTAVVAMAPFIVLLYLLNPVSSPQSVPTLFAYEALGCGVFSGLLWSAGNVCLVGALDKVDYGVAIPVSQMSILISSLWGLGLFGELREMRDAVFIYVIGAGLVVFGSLLLILSN